MNLDDIVFENRNKEYGAYSIRKHYSDRLSRAVILSVGFVALLLIIPTIFKTQRVIPEIIRPEGIKIIASPPPIKLEEIQRPITTPVQRAVQDLAPRVTTLPEVTTPTEIIEQPVAGSDEGEVGGEPVTAGATDLGIAAAAPVIVEPPKVWQYVEIMPSYKGGMEAMIRFLSTKLRYPSIAQRTGTQGNVFVSFIIGADGNVMDAKVIKSLSKECDAEALRVISMMPSWNPGIQAGIPVMVRMVLPIKFQLQEN